MCRWLAYSGPELVLEDLLFKPENSLIQQSLAATRSIATTNGDGFGVGWYGQRTSPGVFRDTLPAWNDANLRSLAQQISSQMFLAHVRASTGTATSRENCHPFRRGRLMFMHNGRVGGYAALRRELEQMIPAEIYPGRNGTTDSEAIFLLACGNGLAEDPGGALCRTVNQILTLMQRSGSDEPFRMTAAVSDGHKIHAVRYSSDRESPSLFYGTGGSIEVADSRVRFRSGAGSVLILSEPLDERCADWREVAEGQLIEVADGQVTLRPFCP
ncbi:MAG: class II glutamine amidotransferase [Proteobacteria bacterium]|nr:class II glutamine amidotransferase [Pseudomonadota bacterium]